MSENQKNESVFDDESMHVGPIYAKALLAAVGSSGNVDALMEQFHSLIHDVFDKQPVLEMALSTQMAMAISRLFQKSQTICLSWI